ncbi:hypothetical protein ACE1B6_03060 [Aerosakkonemataceae cyanobacterium BLCC-F154]|uniref:SH3 domain-containing protein n=1 Tax=Floridaenema fluviatile BLCC-F154 TaxID=3153640 RepID=A0ABV4Y681_9CYAN
MKRIVLVLATITVCLCSSTLTTKAETICKVTDPTGTPLNVRDRPNGKVINTLRNGRQIRIDQLAEDEKGRTWAKVGSFENGKYRVWGWVIREFVSCYNR